MLQNSKPEISKTTSGMILMAAVMVARGSSFIFSKWLLEDLAPVNILAVRFPIAFFILCVIFFQKIKKTDRTTFFKGMLLGIVYTLCMIAEMNGLRYLDAGVSAFIENSAILIVPIYVSILTRTLPKKMAMLCALIAVSGIGFLTISGGFDLNVGIILAVTAALIYGACIMITDVVTREGDPITMGIIQIGFMGLFSIIYTFLFEKPVLPQNATQWGMILMLALVCSCFGFTFQPLAQKYISAETAGVFAAVNPLTTCVLGMILHEEAFGICKVIGGVLIVTAVLISIKSGAKE